MQFLFLVAVAFLIVLLGLEEESWRNAEKPPATVKTSIDQAWSYESFALAARKFVAVTTPPASATAYYWASIKTAPGIPEGQKNLSFPPDWRVVIGPSGWAICASFDGPLLVQSDHVRISTIPSGGMDHAIIGASSVADEATIKTLCNVH